MWRVHSCLRYLLYSRWLASISLLAGPPPNPVSVPFRAPTDGVGVGEQLRAEDVPLPVCQSEQLHVLHRLFSGKVGPLPETMHLPNSP